MGIAKIALIERAIRYLVGVLQGEMITEPKFFERLNQKKYKQKIEKVMKKLKIFEETLMYLILNEETYQDDIVIDFESNDTLLRALQAADIDLEMLPNDVSITISEKAIDFKFYHEIIED